MSRFTRRPRRQMPVLSTAALPDLIFTLLFFFLIVTDEGEPPSAVPIALPADVQLETLEREASVHTLYIGRRDSGQVSVRPYLQLDYRKVQFEELTDVLRALREATLREGETVLCVTLKADADLEMEVIEEVKQALRAAGVTRIRYAADEADAELSF